MGAGVRRIQLSCWGKLCVEEPEEVSMSRCDVEQSSHASWHALKIWF